MRGIRKPLFAFGAALASTSLLACAAAIVGKKAGPAGTLAFPDAATTLAEMKKVSEELSK